MSVPEFDVVIVGGGIVGSAVANLLSAKGKRIALIERGDASPAGMAPPHPEVHFTQREHLGCKQARNHVLGGNGHFWGGGLMRPPSTSFHDCVGLQYSSWNVPSEDLARNFQYVERMLGVHSSPARSPFSVVDPRIGPCELAEICVLPAKSRNTSLAALRGLDKVPGTEILTSAEVIDFLSDNSGSSVRTIHSVSVRHNGGTRLISGKKFLISAGTIDSNLLVLANATQLGLAGRAGEIGSRMHDHFSLPIARVKLSGRRALRELLAPKFYCGTVVGQHFELACGRGWGARGFLHFQFNFDDVSPYLEIKELLSMRQRAASRIELLKAAMPIFAKAPELVRIGIERFLSGRLYLSDRLSILATLDFETFPNDHNKLRLVDGRVNFSWNIEKEDEESFIGLARQAKHLIGELENAYGMQVEHLNDFTNDQAARAYLHANATDTFHLGGGLRVGVSGTGLVDEKLRLMGTDNVYVISSAIFARPGVVNPTHTLLALAHRFVVSNFS